ncbi:hypothetical protein ASPZODRAFT_155085 [Penicilliopsis zonata CBS 506.65]|uniref:Rho-GAP domain-containing protein n=1 Tax=Penicilliopsis zonata CBS 506.65 TaxID=1073090 RepID=A0A1L9S6N3_9EURO|nr:hypothetical protein ASPZODRAFT_155085 [Penicilliopsis zonata CBS 506.65]OJJ42836.1 hypothetical protein ASPZODRAFT_155085 [Penicilliopsis zonata CBS 506.65]
MVTGKSQPGADHLHHFAPTPARHEAIATSPPSKRDLASWWRQFKRNTRKEEPEVEVARGIFGVPLNVSIKYANVAISLTNDNGGSFIYGYVPIVVAKCGVFLKEKATDVEGIFRLNGSAKRIKDLQEIFDSPERYGKGLDWSGYTVHDAANVLRRYLNQLPEPIVPLEFYERFREPLRIYQRQVQATSEQAPVADADKFDHPKAVATYQQLIRELPPLNKQLLLYILDLLAVFASKSDQNRMTSANLSAIFQPGLLSHPQHDMSPDEYKLSQDVLIFLIENQDHFLFGMNGTAADEETMKEVESGLAPRPNATRTTSIRRSVSSASNGTDGLRKSANLRRNVSVSSRNSRQSSNAPSPGTPTSLTGSGVHRSNTLPSKMSPALSHSRYNRPTAETVNNNNNPPPQVSTLNPASAAHSRSASRSASRTPPPPPPPPPPPHEVPSTTSTPGTVYIHTSTHGPIPVNSAEAPSFIALKQTLPDASTAMATLPPPPLVTPTKERKLSSFFSKSPPSGDQREGRQPNRLRKKRIPGSANESAQSSSQSLQAVIADSTLMSVPRSSPDGPGGAADSTPRATTGLLENNNETTPQVKRDPNGRDTASAQTESSHVSENTLRPHGSRTPSMNSRSSFTDHSDFDQPEEAAVSSKSDRNKDHRRSWRFQRSAKRSSNEHIGLGLGSPPLIAVNPGATQSNSSFGSSLHHASKTSPPPPPPPPDPSNHPISLNSELSGSSAASPPRDSSEPEKKSLLGKFRAKVAQVREGVVKDWDTERERAKSPTPSDGGRSVSSQILAPNGTETAKPVKPVPMDLHREPNFGSSPIASPPMSPPVTSGFPPVIPEEPPSPELTTAVPHAVKATDTVPPAAAPAAAPVAAPAADVPVDSVAVNTSAVPEATDVSAPAADAPAVSEAKMEPLDAAVTATPEAKKNEMTSTPPNPPSTAGSSSSSSSSSSPAATPGPVGILATQPATIYSYLHPALLLSVYAARFPSLVADPVTELLGTIPLLAVLQLSYAVICLPAAGSAPVDTPTNSGASSPGSRKKKRKVESGISLKLVPALLSLFLSISLATPVLAALLVLFGSPLTTHQAHTMLCAAHMALLSSVPLVYVHGVDGAVWKDVWAFARPLDAVWGGALGTCVGAWLGAIPIPLDWDRPWQAFPITILTGAYIGYALGSLFGRTALVYGKRVEID